MILLAVVLLLTIYVVYYYISEFLDRRKSPPGPVSFPVVGNAIQVALADKIPHLALASFSTKYGEICRLKIGGTVNILLSSVEAIQGALSNDEASGRDLKGTFSDRNLGQTLGIILSEGPHWEMTRTWTIKTLKEHGFGKTYSMENSIQHEIDLWFEESEKKLAQNGNILQISQAFIMPVIRIIWKMMFADCPPEDEIILIRLIHKSEEALKKGVLGVGLINAFPILRFIFPETTGHNIFMDLYTDGHKSGKELLQRANVNVQEGNSKGSLAEEFVRKMYENPSNPIFSEDNFSVIFMDLLQASSDSTASFLESMVLYCTLYPETQDKIYEEILEILPEDQVDYSYRKRMVYTDAFMCESLRHTKIAQNLMPRKVLNDFYYKNYLIKKGYVLVADLHSAYTDKEVWGDDAEEFRPERFINETNEVVGHKNLVDFGVGKRKCPGELLAFTAAFMFFVSVIRKYKISIPHGFPIPRKEMCAGITSRPFPFEVLFTKR